MGEIENHHQLQGHRLHKAPSSSTVHQQQQHPLLPPQNQYPLWTLLTKQPTPTVSPLVLHQAVGAHLSSTASSQQTMAFQSMPTMGLPNPLKVKPRPHSCPLLHKEGLDEQPPDGITRRQTNLELGKQLWWWICLTCTQIFFFHIFPMFYHHLNLSKLISRQLSNVLICSSVMILFSLSQYFKNCPRMPHLSRLTFSFFF